MADTPDLYHQLRETIADWVTLTDAQWNTLASIFAEKQFRKGEHVTYPGTGEHEVLYVGTGLLRFYYVGDQESNKAFVAESDFAGPLVAAARGLPLDYGVQALEATRLLAAPYPDFVDLVDRSAVFGRLRQKLLERLLVHKEVRTQSLLQSSARERYLAFLDAHGDLFQRIPQYHVASYLGISDVHLSRIRRSIVETPDG